MFRMKKDYIKITDLNKMGICERCSSLDELTFDELKEVSFRVTNYKNKKKNKIKVCDKCLKGLLKMIIEE